MIGHLLIFFHCVQGLMDADYNIIPAPSLVPPHKYREWLGEGIIWRGNDY